MLRALKNSLFVTVLLTCATTAYASATVGSVDPSYKFAWSNVGGYVNFAPTQGGLTITDSAIVGYAWSANSGYINFDTNLSGVTNDGEGNLGGFAWGEGAGWISFAGVTIDDVGRFHGTATGGTVNGASYTISFDCGNCDVRTDWRPDSESGGNGSSGGSRVTMTPGSDLSVEPNEPPPIVPATGTGAGTDGGTNGNGMPGGDVSGDGISEMYPSGELLNPSAPGAASATGPASSTPSNEDRKLPFIVGGGILALLVFFLILLFFRRKFAL